MSTGQIILILGVSMVAMGILLATVGECILGHQKKKILRQIGHEYIEKK